MSGSGACRDDLDTWMDNLPVTEHDDEPPAPRAGERDVAQHAIAYLVLNGVVNSGQYWPDEIVKWAQDLMTGEPRCGVELVRLAIEQHATLVAQRERLISALLNAKRCLERPDRSQLSVRKAIAKADKLLATIEQEGEAR